jgi:hypothetical protein
VLVGTGGISRSKKPGTLPQVSASLLEFYKLTSINIPELYGQDIALRGSAGIYEGPFKKLKLRAGLWTNICKVN